MGDFRLVIEASGSHGCDRQLGEMDIVYGCGSMNCPDCQFRALVKTLRDMGYPISKAELTHWPADIKNEDGSERYKKENEVRDDLLTRIRSGKFPEYEERRKATLAIPVKTES